MAMTSGIQERLDEENGRHREEMVRIHEEYEAAREAENGKHYLNVQEIRESASRG